MISVRLHVAIATAAGTIVLVAVGAALSGPATGIDGTVLVEPWCPGAVRVSGCARPASLPVEVVRDARVVARARSGPNGRFRVTVRPGRYVVRAIAAGRLRYAAQKRVTVPQRGYVRVTLRVDLGIRSLSP